MSRPLGDQRSCSTRGRPARRPSARPSWSVKGGSSCARSQGLRRVVLLVATVVVMVVVVVDVVPVVVAMVAVVVVMVVVVAVVVAVVLAVVVLVGSPPSSSSTSGFAARPRSGSRTGRRSSPPCLLSLWHGLFDSPPPDLGDLESGGAGAGRSPAATMLGMREADPGGRVRVS